MIRLITYIKSKNNVLMQLNNISARREETFLSILEMTKSNQHVTDQ